MLQCAKPHLADVHISGGGAAVVQQAAHWVVHAELPQPQHLEEVGEPLQAPLLKRRAELAPKEATAAALLVRGPDARAD